MHLREHFEFGAVQKCVTLADIKNAAKLRINNWLRYSRARTLQSLLHYSLLWLRLDSFFRAQLIRRAGDVCQYGPQIRNLPLFSGRTWSARGVSSPRSLLREESRNLTPVLSSRAEMPAWQTFATSCSLQTLGGCTCWGGSSQDCLFAPGWVLIYSTIDHFGQDVNINMHNTQFRIEVQMTFAIFEKNHLQLIILRQPAHVHRWLNSCYLSLKRRR